MLTENMPAGAAESARKRLITAAEDLDDNQVAGLVLEFAAEVGVTSFWEQVCLPLLGALRGHSAAEIAVEHALSEGVRVGLDVFRREPTRPLPVEGVLLAGAEHETHCLGLHALAAALREHGRGCLHLGPALPWPALASAAARVRPRVVVVWSQTPVTGRAYRLVRLRRDVPDVRLLAAGPGWIEPFPPGPAAPRRLTTLAEATAACLKGGAPA
ncbi:transcriptional regulator [Micromonospora sp. RP3T]|uniref:transcriptional regulator n=1 Tax=Micromonospora sp. RP3T TaxID=2135446 RepID=UPI003D715481